MNWVFIPSGKTHRRELDTLLNQDSSTARIEQWDNICGIEYRTLQHVTRSAEICQHSFIILSLEV